MKKCYAFLLLMCISLVATAQTFTTIGSASQISENEFQLTADGVQNQVGAVWSKDKIDLRYDFTINTQIFLGYNDDFGADGIAFVLQPLGIDQIGNTSAGGMGLGYYQITPSFAVEFDTWQNYEINDPIEDHLAFMRTGDIVHNSVNNPENAATLPNIEDGQWHEATFSWKASTRLFLVRFLANTYVYEVDIIQTILGGSSYVYWGFTGATGAASNDQRIRIFTNNLTWYQDADGDGWGNPNSTKEAPTQPRGYVANNLDCNDKNKTKGGPEVCDGRDNDCDGVIDNGFATTAFYSDLDGDGYGTPKRMKRACTAPPRYVSNSGDCNDDNASVYPGAPERCDGRDNDCNGKPDDGLVLKPFYWDGDKDGYGFVRPVWACSVPVGHTAIGGDCNDEDPNIHPGAVEHCDGVDEDCDGIIDDGFVQKRFYKDRDGDGWGSNSNQMAGCAPAGYIDRRGDCNDYNVSVHPGAVEVWGNGVDDNCNGQIDEMSSVTTGTRPNKAIDGQKEQSAVCLQLIAVPNPAASYFSLRIESGSNRPVQLRVVDAVGRIVELRQGLPANTPVRVGRGYRPGVYYAQAIQQGKQATVKLVKTAQ